MSTDAATISFPAPIGGWPIKLDFAPSIIFVLVYTALLGTAIFRVSKKQSRNVVVCVLMLDMAERMALWSLRAWLANTPSQAPSKGLLTYFQVAFSAGYLNIWAKFLALLRCLVVNSTNGTTFSDGDPNQSTGEIPMLRLQEQQRAQAEGGILEAPKPVLVEDQPRTRAMYRKVFELINPLQFVPIVLGALIGNWYPDAETDHGKARTVETLRYVNAGVGVVLVLIFHIIAIYALFNARNVRRRPLIYLYVITSILEIVPIYQLVIVKDMTTSILSRDPGSQNTPGEKAWFYVLQVVPEVACAISLLAVNTKTMFDTGTWADMYVSKLKKLFSR